ncbi:MAG: hypothetical protein Q9157_002377 [Trypethelium eluteriae]
MVSHSGPNRRFLILYLIVAGLLTVYFVLTFRRQAEGVRHPLNDVGNVPAHHVDMQDSTLTGHAIAPKLGNETVKAELGRAAWKLFHTTMARFPEKPSADEKNALHSYILLFARLYPCGECAHHFQTILNKYPPQVTSRNTAAGWACHVHNEVNKSLDKEEFDCSKIGDFYDCGCADDETGSTDNKSNTRTLSDDLVSSKSNGAKEAGVKAKKAAAPLPQLEKEE